MGYVIYDKASTKLKSNSFKTVSAANAALICMNKSGADTQGLLGNEPEAPQFTMGIAEIGYYYEHIEKTVTRVNMMSGAEYTESVNTPLCCSPASETYWSM